MSNYTVNGSKRQQLTDANFPAMINTNVLKAARGEATDTIPTWIMRQAGRYLPEFRAARVEHDFFTVCRTPELACKVTLQPIDRYPGLLDASIIFSDILVVPQAMGMTVEMVPKLGPHFPDPLNVPADMAKLTKIVDVDAELGYVFDALTLTRKELKGRVPLIGFAGAPWTLMAYMVEGGGSKTFSKAKSWLYLYPNESKELLQRITDVIVEYLIGQVRAGAQMFQVFDSWAGELSPDAFFEFSYPYLKQIAERVHKQAPVPMIVFAKGAHYAVEKLAQDTMYNVVGLDWTMDPARARGLTKGKAVQGNMDPSILFAPPDTIRAECRKMLQGFNPKQGGYIANLGHGMYPNHDPERLKVYLEEIKAFKK